MKSDWQTRSRMLLGDKCLQKLKNKHIVIAGLGGVGSWTAEHIARSGIGKITIIDNDIVSESNINRQLHALHSTIGERKTILIKTRLLDINPELDIEAIDIFIDDNNFKNILSSKPDYILDCIDTLSPKINLIKYSLDNNIPLISALGSGGRLDPQKIRIDDISNSYNCYFGRMLRKRLHKIGIYTGFDAVYSPELIDKSKIILEESRNKKSNIGTISYIPSIMGSMMAGYVIYKMIKEKANPGKS